MSISLRSTSRRDMEIDDSPESKRKVSILFVSFYKYTSTVHAGLQFPKEDPPVNAASQGTDMKLKRPSCDRQAETTLQGQPSRSSRRSLLDSLQASARNLNGFRIRGSERSLLRGPLNSISPSV